MDRHRIGLIVPSSNTTVETEVPELLGRHESEKFSFHASRTRLKKVSPEHLAAMNAQRERAVIELGDAGVEVILNACLVALMVVGPGEHYRVEGAIAEQLAQGGSEAKVRSSAGALIEALNDLGAKKIALVTPYMKPLAEKVVSYIEAEGVKVSDWRALEVEDNLEVGRIPGETVMEAMRSLDLTDVDVIVISACVQMPSLDLVDKVEQETGIPTISAATAGAYSILKAMGLPRILPGAGSLLRPKSDAPEAAQK